MIGINVLVAFRFGIAYYLYDALEGKGSCYKESCEYIQTKEIKLNYKAIVY